MFQITWKFMQVRETNFASRWWVLNIIVVMTRIVFAFILLSITDRKFEQEQ